MGSPPPLQDLLLHSHSIPKTSRKCLECMRALHSIAIRFKPPWACIEVPLAYFVSARRSATQSRDASQERSANCSIVGQMAPLSSGRARRRLEHPLQRWLFPEQGSPSVRQRAKPVFPGISKGVGPRTRGGRTTGKNRIVRQVSRYKSFIFVQEGSPYVQVKEAS